MFLVTIFIDPNSGLWGPFNWTLAGILVPTAIGVILLWFRWGRSSGLGIRSFVRLICIASLWMAVASRALHVAEYAQYYIDAPHRAFYLWSGGYDLLGALLGLGGFVFVIARRLPGKQHLFVENVLFITAVALAIAGLLQWILGTVPGTNTALPWAVTYRTTGALGFGNGEPIHPVGLYRAILAILVGANAWAYSRTNQRDRTGAPMTVIAYAIGSVGIGFTIPHSLILGLGIGQWCACLTLLVGIAWYAKSLRIRNRN